MTLAPGTRLGPYEILAWLGAGGMGEVYRARDPRLARDVAVKILNESFATDADRLRRFEQEARAVGAMNHPNILSIHDLGERNGLRYIVTELLEGTTLREKLRSGRLGARRAIEYGIQLAQGLAAAHEKGIVHRDLKPENVFITEGGRVKILDFGLVKRTERAGGSSTNDTTLASSDYTSAGMLLGTVGYMSPEQVRGQVVDPRTDIFAFGAVLYEMLTGLRAFKKDSSAETMTAILKEDPPDIVSNSDGQIPPALLRVVRHCLEKDARQRFQSAKDLNFALENISADSSPTQTQERGVLAPSWNAWRTAALVLAVVLLVAISLGLRPLLVSPRQANFQEVTFRKGAVELARFAPDGHTIVYTAAWNSPSAKVYSSRENGTEVRDLEQIGEIQGVSRSGELAIILDSGTLARVPLNGGAPRELLEKVVAADWSPDGSQLAVARLENGKCRLEYPVGKPLYETIGSISHMRIAPQGDAIAFMEHPMPADDRGTVVVVDLKGNKRTLTQEWTGEAGLAWSPDGSEILFTATKGTENERDLYAVRRSGKQRLIYRAPGGIWLEDVASDGRILLKHQERRFEVTVGKVGGPSRPLSSLQIMLLGSVSRDGTYVVMNDLSGSGGTDYHIYLAKLDGSPAVLLGNGVASGISPDNQWVTSILPSDTSKVLLLPIGAGEPKTVTAPGFVYHRAAWAGDGNSLVIRASDSGHPLRFWLQNIDGSTPRPITPEGVDTGVLLTVHDVEYVGARDSNHSIRLYPIDGREPKAVTGIVRTDTLIGGAPEADAVYVSPDRAAIPQQIVKVNIVTGLRQSFTAISPTDPAGILALGTPIITADGKRYVGTQIRQDSVLYVATGLK
jgi:serine/threonine protein kinase/Tol biopolymer transport system component